MAKHLSKGDIEAIVEIIRAWPVNRITWDAVCEAAEIVVGKIPTRQSLNAHEAIKEAYTAKKKGLVVHGPRTAMPSSLAVAAQRIARLQSQIDELAEKNNRLLEQFAKWQYNAYKHGVLEHQLNEPLPVIDRERTV